MDILSDIQLLPGPLLYLKSDWKQRVLDTRSAGADQFMSSVNLYRFLNMLLRLVARLVCVNIRRHCQFKPTLLIVWSQCPDLGWYFPLPCLGNASEWQNHDPQCRIYRLTSHCTDGFRGRHLFNYMDYTVVVSNPKIAGELLCISLCWSHFYGMQITSWTTREWKSSSAMSMRYWNFSSSKRNLRMWTSMTASPKFSRNSTHLQRS